jgi:hypothetical protein
MLRGLIGSDFYLQQGEGVSIEGGGGVEARLGDTSRKEE